MHKLSGTKTFSMDEIAKELNLSKKLLNNIKRHFGEVISLNDLFQIKRNEFCQCKGLGSKSWSELRNALSVLAFDATILARWLQLKSRH